MTVDYRRANPLDARDLNDVNRAAWDQAYRGLFPDQIFEAWNDDDRTARWMNRIETGSPVWVGVVEGRIVAYGTYRAECDIATIVQLYVHPDFQRRGLASGLMREMVRESGSSRVNIYALVGNDAANAVYADRWGGESIPDGLFELDGFTYVKHGYMWPNSAELIQRLTPIRIREFTGLDDIDTLTDLIHRGYRRMAEAGLHFVATHQSAETTRSRIQYGTCFVAEVDGVMVGTIVMSYPEDQPYCGYESERPIASFSQFTVVPDWQGAGVGTRLLRHVEGLALQMGAREIGLNTAQPATELIAYYERMGYRIVCDADWRPEVNYKSWVMVKQLAP